MKFRLLSLEFLPASYVLTVCGLVDRRLVAQRLKDHTSWLDFLFLYFFVHEKTGRELA